MILRRFMKHVTEQNWFAVVLDVIVVITGIFLGMQVTEWNEDRKEQAQEVQYLDRMIDEADVAIASHQDYIIKHNVAISVGVELISALTDQSNCKDNDEKLIQQMMTMTSFPPPRLRLATIEELSQSGQMRFIRSEVVREAMAKASDDLAFLKLQWNRYREFKTSLDRELFSVSGFVATSINMSDELEHVSKGVGYLTTPEALFGYLMTPEALCGNSRLIGQASGEQTTHQSYMVYILEFELSLKSYADKLASYRKSLN